MHALKEKVYKKRSEIVSIHHPGKEKLNKYLQDRLIALDKSINRHTSEVININKQIDLMNIERENLIEMQQFQKQI